MGTERYDDLIRRMPEIAAAINDFASEEVQVRAFGALVGALGFDIEAQTENGDDSGAGPVPNKTATSKRGAARKSAAKKATDGTGAAKKSPGRRSAGASFTVLKELNLHPKGKLALKDFAAECKPTSMNEKCLIAVYWCEHEAGETPVTHDHIFTCFRHMGWPLPGNLGNKVSQTGSMGWLNSTTRDNVTVGPNGINHVEQVMLKRESDK